MPAKKAASPTKAAAKTAPAKTAPAKKAAAKKAAPAKKAGRHESRNESGLRETAAARLHAAHPRGMWRGLRQRRDPGYGARAGRGGEAAGAVERRAMHFVVHCLDHAGAGAARLAHYEAHKAYLAWADQDDRFRAVARPRSVDDDRFVLPDRGGKPRRGRGVQPGRPVQRRRDLGERADTTPSSSASTIAEWARPILVARETGRAIWPRDRRSSTKQISSSAQRAIYDNILSGPRGVVQGPLRVWLQSPELAEPAEKLGAFCRYGSRLPPRLSELAIIAVGAHWRAGYEWQAHAPLAERAGVSSDAIEAIRRRADVRLEQADEQAVYEFSRELLETRGVSDAAYARLVAAVGLEAAVDLVGILGYYTLICMTINAFGVPVPAGVAEPFADDAGKADRN